MLKVKQVSLKYASTEVVKNVSLDLQKGERLVIVGASGCGKTTLLKAISGFHPISKGIISFNNNTIIDPTQQLVPGHEHIKLVNQDFNLDDYHTVEENIRLRLLQFDKDYLNERVEELLRLTELQAYKKAKAIELSGGQKQRLAIARALADEPDLLLLDEPFNQLDYHLKHKIENYILDYLASHSISSILVSHNGEEAMRWANKIAFMKNGKISRIDTAENFYNYPQNKYEAAFFGVLNTILINRKEVSFRPNDFSVKETKTHNQLINIDFINQISKGWFTSYQYKHANRIVSLYSQIKSSHLTKVWVKTIDFKS